MLNVFLGIAGQVLLTLVPMYLILSKWFALGIVTGLFIVISFTMKRTWWNKLSDFKINFII